VRGARARAALLRFVTPRGCVMPGRRFRVAVRSRPLVPIRRVDFFVGRRRVARDRRAPFAAMLMTSRHARPGARLHLRARVVVDVAQRSRDRSMRAVVRICG
jgi:hypothetical protein